MTIQQYTGQAIKPGQWINLDTHIRLSFAGSVAYVLDVKPKSVKCQVFHLGPDGVMQEAEKEPVIRRLTSITFVCDTVEEAQSVREESLKFFQLEFAEDKRQRELQAQRRAFAISIALKGKA